MNISVIFLTIFCYSFLYLTFSYVLYFVLFTWSILVPWFSRELQQQTSRENERKACTNIPYKNTLTLRIRGVAFDFVFAIVRFIIFLNEINCALWWWWRSEIYAESKMRNKKKKHTAVCGWFYCIRIRMN